MKFRPQAFDYHTEAFNLLQEPSLSNNCNPIQIYICQADHTNDNDDDDMIDAMEEDEEEDKVKMIDRPLEAADQNKNNYRDSLYSIASNDRKEAVFEGKRCNKPGSVGSFSSSRVRHTKQGRKEETPSFVTSETRTTETTSQDKTLENSFVPGGARQCHSANDVNHNNLNEQESSAQQEIVQEFFNDSRHANNTLSESGKNIESEITDSGTSKKVNNDAHYDTDYYQSVYNYYKIISSSSFVLKLCSEIRRRANRRRLTDKPCHYALSQNASAHIQEWFCNKVIFCDHISYISRILQRNAEFSNFEANSMYLKFNSLKLAQQAATHKLLSMEQVVVGSDFRANCRTRRRPEQTCKSQILQHVLNGKFGTFLNKGASPEYQNDDTKHDKGMEITTSTIPIEWQGAFYAACGIIHLQCQYVILHTKNLCLSTSSVTTHTNSVIFSKQSLPSSCNISKESSVLNQNVDDCTNKAPQHDIRSSRAKESCDQDQNNKTTKYKRSSDKSIPNSSDNVAASSRRLRRRRRRLSETIKSVNNFCAKKVMHDNDRVTQSERPKKMAKHKIDERRHGIDINADIDTVKKQKEIALLQKFGFSVRTDDATIDDESNERPAKPENVVKVSKVTTGTTCNDPMCEVSIVEPSHNANSPLFNVRSNSYKKRRRASYDDDNSIQTQNTTEPTRDTREFKCRSHHDHRTAAGDNRREHSIPRAETQNERLEKFEPSIMKPPAAENSPLYKRSTNNRLSPSEELLPKETESELGHQNDDKLQTRHIKSNVSDLDNQNSKLIDGNDDDDDDDSGGIINESFCSPQNSIFDNQTVTTKLEFTPKPMTPEKFAIEQDSSVGHVAGDTTQNEIAEKRQLKKKARKEKKKQRKEQRKKEKKQRRREQKLRSHHPATPERKSSGDDVIGNKTLNEIRQHPFNSLVPGERTQHLPERSNLSAAPIDSIKSKRRKLHHDTENGSNVDEQNSLHLQRESTENINKFQKNDVESLVCSKPAAVLLCSESFLELWGSTIAALASGTWATSQLSNVTQTNTGCNNQHDAIAQENKIVFIDSPSLDYVGVDIEYGCQCAIIITSLSGWAVDGGSRAFIRRIVQLSSKCRYKQVDVMLCADAEINQSLAENLAQLQTCMTRQNCQRATNISFRMVTESSLSGCIAHIVLPHQQFTTLSKLESIVRNPRVRERLIFLLELLPTLSVGGAISLLTTTKPLNDFDVNQHEDWSRNVFQKLLCHKNQKRQLVLEAIRKLKGYDDLNAISIYQLSYAVHAPLVATFQRK